MRFFGLIFLGLSLPIFASTNITTQIHDLDYGRSPDDEILILLKSGQVLKLPKLGKALIRGLDKAKAFDEWLTISWDQERYITGIKSASPPSQSENQYSPEVIAEKGFIPTTIASMEVARNYFRESRRTRKEETQCFNRAIVWSYEWWKKHSLKSNKLLIFFTRTYIRRYNFEWWFHIAPYVHVLDEGRVVERVMDVKYSSGPIEFRRWTNIFMNGDLECPVIKKYSEYADHPYSGECFIYRTHMYTYQPADLQMYEAWDYKKNAFNMDEVKGAYLEAFDINL